MPSNDQTVERAPRAPVRLIGHLGMAAVASLAVIHWGHYGATRGGAVISVCAHAAMPGPPIVMVDLVCSPRVDQPAPESAGFGSAALPEVATVATVQQGRQVRLARIGGLHGP